MKSLTKTLILAPLMAGSVVAEARFIDRIMDRLDANEDGQISQEEFNMRDRGMMNRLDANDDGVVTVEEINRHIDDRKSEIVDRMATEQEQAIIRFQAADIDGDGMVTAEEARTEAFNHIDENGDGQLSTEELRNGRPNHRNRHDRFGKFKRSRGSS